MELLKIIDLCEKSHGGINKLCKKNHVGGDPHVQHVILQGLEEGTEGHTYSKTTQTLM